jgi:hypothetical protein
MILRSWEQILVRCSCVCLLLGGVSVASAADYEVDGHVEQTLYKRDGGVSALQKSQFTVYVKGCSWLIRTTQSDTNGKPVSASETAFVNGTEVYELSGQANNRNTAIGGGTSRNMASIESNNVPTGQKLGYYVCHLWLMYASGCYFDHRSNSWLTPAYDLNASVNVEPNLKRKAIWELIDGPGSLPKNVLYYQVYDDYMTNVSSIDATYTATGVTNAGTIKIPSGFVFENRIRTGYLPGPDPPGRTRPAYGIWKRAVGTVTAVRPYCSRKDLTPTAKGKTMVVDRRVFQEQGSKLAPNSLTYYVSEANVPWLPFAQAKKAYVVPQAPPKPISRGIIVAILLLPTALFASLWLLTRKRA